MWEIVLTIFNLTFAGLSLTLGTVKVIAVRREPGLALNLTASVLLLCGLIFLLATPSIYRFVGESVSSPNIPALLIPVATLLCVGHAHVMTQLWQPARSTPQELRRWRAAWLPLYLVPPMVMTSLYFLADLPGQAQPLRFAAVYAHIPEVLALEFTYFAALTTGVVASILQCRKVLKVLLPDLPDLAKALSKCILWFSVALALDLANAALQLTAMISAIDGDHHLDALAETAWLATIASCFAANWGLGMLVFEARRGERSDYRTLKPLWKIIVADSTPQLILRTLPFSRDALPRLIIEISDGSRYLGDWMSAAPARAVEVVREHQLRVLEMQAEHGDELTTCMIQADIAASEEYATWLLTQSSEGSREYAHFNVVAAQAAATLLYADALRRQDRPPANPEQLLTQLPGNDLPEEDERPHLVRVAQYATGGARRRSLWSLWRKRPNNPHPIVVQALMLAAEGEIHPRPART